MTTTPKMPTTWGEAIDAFPTSETSKKMKAAIESDARKRAESERLHPLKDYPYRPNFGYPIDPSA